jgi:hypothetical protein
MWKRKKLLHSRTINGNPKWRHCLFQILNEGEGISSYIDNSDTAEIELLKKNQNANCD